jgi:hypothetical protein
MKPDVVDESIVDTVKHTDQELVDDNPSQVDDDEALTEETPNKGDKGALWLLAGVVALAGGTLWMIRDVWTAKPVAMDSAQIESVASPSAAASASGALPSARARLADDTSEAHEATLPGEDSDIEQRRRQKAERLTELKLEAEQMERERLAAEKELEMERAAREALEQERRAAEQRLARELAVREALEQERRAAEQRLAQERRQAEQRLAQERAARAELERKAKLEKQRLLRAKQAAEQAALDRARAEAELAEVNARAAAGSEAQAAESAASATPDPVAVQTTSDAVASPQGDATDSSFSSNPCDGPSARFLSTCR